jgi:hypothetical protein
VVYMVERKGGRVYQIRSIRQQVLLKPLLWETIAVYGFFRGNACSPLHGRDMCS